MEQIKELLNYSLARDVDLEDYVKELVKILTSKNSLQSYLKFLAFNSHSKLSIFDIFSISAYDMTNDGIIIFKYDFDKVAEDKFNKLGLAENLRKKFRLYLITQAILHETEHTSQKKMFLEGINTQSLEYKLVYLTLRHLYQKYPDNFTEEKISDYQDRIESVQFAFYNSSPTERFAEIKSNTCLFNIVDEEEIKASFQKEIRERSLRGYSEEVCSPTIYFFKNLHREDKLKTGSEFKHYKSYLSCIEELSFYDEDENKMISNAVSQYSLNERLFYGFPITTEEYRSLKK